MKDTDKTREQLIEEIKLLRILIDSLPDRLYVKDKDSRFVIYNKAVAQDSELPPPADFTGKSDFDTFTPEKAKVFYDEEQRIIKTGQSVVNRQVHRLLRGGQDSWSLVTKVPWRDNSGNIIGIIGSNREITELKKAQLALQESENRYKAIFETTREGILAADIETKQFKYANPAACRMFGYTAEEMRQLSVCDI